MSKSRYTKIRDLLFNSYYLDCPLDIDKGAILKDNEQNTILLQLRLNNVSDEIINSVHVIVECFDDTWDKIPGVSTVEYAYLDLAITMNSSFGEKSPIILDSRVRNVSTKIVKVMSANDVIWRNIDTIEFQSPNQKPIDQLSLELVDQLKREAADSGMDGINRSIYFPEVLDDLWLCSCGRANEEHRLNCRRCGMNREWIFKYTRREYLAAKLSEYNERLNVEVQRRKENETIVETKRIKKIKKYKISSIVAIIGLVIMVMFWKAVVEPNNKYNKGIALIDSHEYESAARIFEELGDHKDSNKLLSDANSWIKYNNAVNFMKTGAYEQAIELFENLKDFSDSNGLIKSAKYKYAVTLFEQKHFVEARQYFESIIDYLDAKDYLNSSYYKIEGTWKQKYVNGSLSIADYNTVWSLKENGQIDETRGLTFNGEWDIMDYQFSFPDDGNPANRVRYEIIKADPNPGGELIIVRVNGMRSGWEFKYEFISD